MGGIDVNDHEGFLWAWWRYSIILIVVVVTSVFKFVKIHQTIHLKWVYSF